MTERREASRKTQVNTAHIAVVLTVAVGLYATWRGLAKADVADPDILKLLLWSVTPILILWVTNRGSLPLALVGVGLKRPFLAALTPGMLGGVAMGAVLLLAGAEPMAPSFETIFDRAIEPAISEEILFRGFLLAKLLAAGLSRWSALALSAVLFGAIHAPIVWNTGDVVTIAANVAITSFGGVVLAALMLMMRGSLFAAIGMHFSINFVWELFAISETAIGDEKGFIARGAAIAVALVSASILRRVIR